MATKIAEAASISTAGMSEWSITTMVAPYPQGFLSRT
jgi:hypothetical protein